MPTDPSRVARIVALISALLGAAGSLVFVLMVGRHNRSVVLAALFILWDLSPFAALLLAGKRRSGGVSTAFSAVTVLLAVATMVIYGSVALGPHRATPAFAFLVVPAVSWLVLIALCIAARVQGRRSRDPRLPHA